MENEVDCRDGKKPKKEKMCRSFLKFMPYKKQEKPFRLFM